MAKKRALVIAVREYDDIENIQPLPFCKNDGERVSEIMKKPRPP